MYIFLFLFFTGSLQLGRTMLLSPFYGTANQVKLLPKRRLAKIIFFATMICTIIGGFRGNDPGPICHSRLKLWHNSEN